MSTIKPLAAAALLTLVAGQAFAETYRCVRSGNHQIDCTRTDGLTSYQRQMWWYNRRLERDNRAIGTILRRDYGMGE